MIVILIELTRWSYQAINFVRREPILKVKEAFKEQVSGMLTEEAAKGIDAGIASLAVVS